MKEPDDDNKGKSRKRDEDCSAGRENSVFRGVQVWNDLSCMVTQASYSLYIVEYSFPFHYTMLVPANVSELICVIL